MTTFVPSTSVYDANGTLLGRIEKFDGPGNYIPTFLPNEEEISADELRDISDYIDNEDNQ